MEKHILEAGVTNQPRHARKTYTQGSITHTFNGTVVETPKNVHGGDDSKSIVYTGITYYKEFYPNFDGTLNIKNGNIITLRYYFQSNLEEYPANLSFDLSVTDMNGDEIMHFGNDYFELEYDEESGTSIYFANLLPGSITADSGELIFTISDKDTGKTLSTVRFGYEKIVIHETDVQ